MLALLQDLYGHQAWADAEHWRALQAHAPALSDASLHKRLHHIHVVQHAFLFLVSRAVTPGTVRGDDPRAAASGGLPDLSAILDSARRHHEAAAAFLAEVGDQALATPIHIPWFPGGGFSLPAGQALMQAAMHSHYHR